MNSIYRPPADELSRDIEILKFTHLDIYRCPKCNKRTILLKTEDEKTTPMCECGKPKAYEYWDIEIKLGTIESILRSSLGNWFTDHFYTEICMQIASQSNKVKEILKQND